MKISESGALKIGKKIVLSDLHLGILGFPDYSLLDRIVEIYEKSKAETLILNGDIKHNLGKAEIFSVKRFMDELKDSVSELIVIRGNHDNLLKNVLELRDYLFERKILITHGHKRIEALNDAKKIVVGHAHPAVLIKDRVGGVKERAWMIGKDCGKEAIVMPAFNEICKSTSVNIEKPLGFIFKHFKEFDVFTISGFYFGKIVFGEEKERYG